MKGKTLEECITAYLRDGHLSPSTRENARMTLARLASALGIGKRINRISHTDVSDYIEDHLRTRNLKPNSLWQYVAQIKSFFNFCVKARFIPYSPAEMIYISRQPEDPNESKAIPHDLLLAMLRYSHARCYRDYALLRVLMCGLRRKGAAGLRLDRINWEKKEVTVFDKGTKYNTYALSDSAVEALREYIHLHRKKTASPNVFITLRTPYKHLEDASISEAVERLCYKAGAEVGYRSHRIRHWFSEMLRQIDAGELTIRDALNHQSEDTTQKHYVKANRPHVHRAVGQIEALLQQQINGDGKRNIIHVTLEDLVG